ncbi:hypothetical protein ACN23B_30850 (plasmid) [Anabaena sp. FACHB-709]|uniref:hypothetical protein n=1 Tax=Nostocaceae TaxID=1162 RepID=UPI00000CF06C|nr:MULTISPECIES: hypothetical protein [Nostocaceae]HBW29100.1 hypothetical protein [Nostoc sp. UBA8866]MBD2266805.1 hypothetical protein [Anabaena sp. FACHB-709]MBD2276393.1 hypothetical protein [Nostoc sp. PCC 7120 = FACHB-418]RUR78641.1 hypothetical protein DSM107007_42540 [Nostoc sp. PCC 7120 = FACHB-418]BAB77494.1 asr9008 [Nostoc sp. PCC 7120 = FACHB-418]
MQNQPLQELVAQAQELLSAIRQHPQYQALQIDADVTLGDVTQFFNTLQWSATSDAVDTTREGFFQ